MKPTRVVVDEVNLNTRERGRAWFDWYDEQPKS